MTVKLSFDEILDIISAYQFEQSCIMDSLDDVVCYKFISASKKFDAAGEIRNKIYEKYIEKIRDRRERKWQ